MRVPVRAPATIIRAIVSWIIVLVILFEEWGWEPLQRLIARMAQLPILRSIEKRIKTLPPYPALVVFAFSGIPLIPLKILAGFAFTNGHYFFGATTFVLAKVLGTAILARIFTLTKPTLMQLAWFAQLYNWFIPWKSSVIAYARATALWRTAHRLKESARARWQMIKLTYFSHDNAL